ncbi:MAG: helix-turn-helix transcriptional regulator [Clostridia bacterium]|nr:helix-turn-helix transcriptional regulator [Clostridia bacterium]
MLKLNAIELLNKRGKTKYWLYKQMGMSYQNFTKMINNETKSIKYDNLEAMCYILDCKIEDLLVITEE